MDFKGLNLDSRPETLPDRTIIWGKNMEVSPDGKSLTNEGGFSMFYEEEAEGYIIIGHIITPTEIIIFSTNGTFSKIVRVDKDLNDTEVISTETFGFDESTSIQGIFTYNYNNELIICFWNGTSTNSTRPFVMNLDNLPYNLTSGEIDVSAWDAVGGGTGGPGGTDPSMSKERASELSRMFPYVKIPNMSLLSIDEGGNIPTATYYMGISYMFDEYDKTPYFMINEPIYIYGKDRNYVDFNDVGVYDKLKDNSGKSFTAQFTNVDQIFNKISVAVIKKTETTLEAFEIGTYNLTASIVNVKFTGDTLGALNVEELIIPQKDFNRILTGTLHKNRLKVANVTELDYNMQPYASEIQANFVTQDVGLTSNIGGSQVYDVKFKSMMPGEVYAFFIHLVYKTGKISRGFHIPGRAAGQYQEESGTIVINEDATLDAYDGAGGTYNPTADELAIDANSGQDAKIFQIRDTSYVSGGLGYFGFWENENESYPYTTDFDGSIPTGGGTDLTGEKVRHHVAPSIYKANTVYNSVANPNEEVKYSIGVRFTNIEIPNAWFEHIDGFVFSYAKRTFGNSQVLAYSPAIQQGWDSATALKQHLRFYDFSLLKEKPSINPAFVKLAYREEEIDDPTTTAILNIVKNEAAIGAITDSVETIESYRYLPADNRLSLPESLDAAEALGNEGKEETLFLETGATNLANLDTDIAMDYNSGTSSDWSLAVIVLRLWKEDVYYPYYNQKLALCSTFFRVTAEGHSKSDTFTTYGFDTFVVNSAFQLNSTLFDGSAYAKIYSGGLTPGTRYRVINPGIIEQSVQNDEQGSTYNTMGDITADFANVGADMSKWKVGYEFIAIADTSVTPNHSPNEWGGSTLMPVGGITINFMTYSPYNIRSAGQPVDDIRPIVNFINWDYRREMHALNDLVAPTPYNPFIDFVTKDPYIIHRSVQQQSESKLLKIRTFLPNEYYKMKDLSKGEITLLRSMDDQIIIHQKYSMFVAKSKDSMLVRDKDGSNLETYLGQTDIFERDPIEMVPVNEGFAGCQSKYASLVCEYGYFFYDLYKARLYHYDGTQLRDLGDGLINTYLDRKSLSTNLDQPFLNKGACLGYNPLTKTIYLTIYYNTSEDCTLSYNLRRKEWIGLHDFLANTYIHTKTNFISISNLGYSANGLGQMYEHNNYALVGNYYEEDDIGTISDNDSYIDLVFTSPMQLNKLFTSIELLTSIRNTSNVQIPDKTISSIMIYNDTQCSGIIPINPSQAYGGDGNISHVYGKWIFNKFNDAVIDNTVAIFNSSKEPTTNVNKNLKNWYELSNFISTFVAVRLIFDNAVGNKNRIYINDTFVNSKVLKA